jgi:hypothetical protein
MKISLFIYIEKIRVSTGKIPCMIQAGESYPLFYYEKYGSM